MAPRTLRTRRARGGLLLIALGVLCYPLGLALMKVGTGADWPLRLLGFGAGGLVIGTSWPLVRLGRRLRVTTGEWAAVEQDSRPPVVYLRPFEADGVEYVTTLSSHVRARPARRFLGETTYEQRLARALADVGPLLAIANPSEGSLPDLGAKRLPAADSEWQARVAYLTSEAGAVIVHAGVSDGLAWEIEHLVARVMPERVIVALPSEAGRGRPSREERYAQFADTFRDVFPRGLPDRAGESQFLFFDADWAPHCFGHRGSQPVRASRGSVGEQRALVLERLRSEFEVSPFPLWLRAAAAVPLLMVAGVAVATAIYAVLQ